MTTFCFTAVPDRDQEAAFRRHMGARRFAFNQCLAVVKEKREARRRDPSVEVPSSGFSLINLFNTWKKSGEAGHCIAVDAQGSAQLMEVGLSWRDEVCAQVFEEAAVDLGRALAAYNKAKGTRRKVGFPGFAKKHQGTQSFRLRNKSSATGRASIRVGEGDPRSITLPVIGTVRLREDTRRFRRLLRDGRGRICMVTVKAHRGRYRVMVTVEAADFHPEMVHEPSDRGFVGVDRGLATYLVAATEDGTEVGRVDGLAPLQRSQTALQIADRRASAKKLHSKNRRRANARLTLIHARVADQRRDFCHRVSSALVKTHDHLCLEDLAVHNMVKNRHLSKAISDASWGMFARMVTYKAAWYGTELSIAPRFYPSTKTCSGCGWVVDVMGLGDRMFSCPHCGLDV